jgi:FMN-dependent oxidoreductase (nitrilotriacetate monooxygenase family)
MAQLHLGLNAPALGTSKSAWRREAIDPAGMATGEFYIRLAQLAEEAFFDAFFLADASALDPGWETNSIARLDPLIALSFAAAHTERIGLVPTVSSTWHHPYNLARSIQSLDRASHGRAGWNVVTNHNPQIAANYGLDAMPAKHDRYARARESVDVVKALWQTWSPDAIVADKAAGTFALKDKVRPVSHQGEYFRVNGGSTVPPSEQGLPVIFQAGASDDGLDLAARHADATFISAMTLDTALDYRRRVELASAAVRAPGRPRVLALPGASLTLASTDEEAQRRKEELDGADGAISGRGYLAGRLGLSPGDLDLDKPIPLEKVDIERQRQVNSEGFLRSILSLAESGKPLRELLRDGSGHLTIVGSPRTVADTFEQWFATGAVDGFNIMLDVIEESLPLFAAEVVPILQERGLFRRKYEGTTLRDHLGLQVPRW